MNDVDRRDFLRVAGAASGAVAVAATGVAALRSAPAAAQAAGSRNDAPLGARLQGVQHFGVTVQNMDRAFAFYTEVLGGTEIMRDGDFQGDAIHNTLLADQEIVARERRVDPRTIGVPDLRDGTQRLDVRFVQFDNVVIELLQYRDARQPMGSGDSWAEPRDHMSPAFPRSMHICFWVRDDVDFDRFIRDLEAECARRGMTRSGRTAPSRWRPRPSAARRRSRPTPSRSARASPTGPRGRAARIRPDARPGQADLRRRVRGSPADRGPAGDGVSRASS